MVSNKSDILKILSNNYPNFLKKDLSKFIEIVLNEIQQMLDFHQTPCFTLFDIGNIGNLLKNYYELHANKRFEQSLCY